jgi:hypothetical protein
LSLNNPQNIEMKIYEKYEVEMLKNHHNYHRLYSEKTRAESGSTHRERTFPYPMGFTHCKG